MKKTLGKRIKVSNQNNKSRNKDLKAQIQHRSKE